MNWAGWWLSKLWNGTRQRGLIIIGNLIPIRCPTWTFIQLSKVNQMNYLKVRKRFLESKHLCLHNCVPAFLMKVPIIYNCVIMKNMITTERLSVSRNLFFKHEPPRSSLPYCWYRLVSTSNTTVKQQSDKNPILNWSVPRYEGLPGSYCRPSCRLSATDCIYEHPMAPVCGFGKQNWISRISFTLF